jgi:heme/copper-type cytochrome/quinol oxidase subunit 3
MVISRRRRVLLVILLFVLVPVLTVVFEAAGREVATAATIGALVALFAAYAGAALLMLRSAADPRARELLRRRGLVPFVVMLLTTLILVSAHPWGVATFAVGGGALVGCQLLLHATAVVMAIRHRRGRGLAG